MLFIRQPFFDDGDTGGSTSTDSGSSAPSSSNQQDYYNSLVSAGSAPDASAEAKGNAAWAQAQSDYTAPQSNSPGNSTPTNVDTGGNPYDWAGKNGSGASAPSNTSNVDTGQQFVRDNNYVQGKDGTWHASSSGAGGGAAPQGQQPPNIPIIPQQPRGAAPQGVNMSGYPQGIDWGSFLSNQRQAMQNAGPTAGQQYAASLAGNPYGANYDPTTAAANIAQDASLGTPGMSQGIYQNFMNQMNSVNPSSSYWDGTRNLANQMGSNAYQLQKQGYQNTINQLNNLKQNNLNSGQQALDDSTFQKFIQQHQGQADRGMLGSGIGADQDFRLQLGRAQQLQNLYNRAMATYDPRIADATTKQGLLNEGLMQNDQFQKFYASQMKNLGTTTRAEMQALGKTLPYDYASVNDKMKNAQASDTLQQKYDALNQKNNADILNNLTGYDKAQLPYQYGSINDLLNNMGKGYTTDANNYTKGAITDANNSRSIYNNDTNNQTKIDVANANNITKDNIAQAADQTRMNIAQLDNNTKALIAQYPYLQQTMNNIADNNTKLTIDGNDNATKMGIAKLNEMVNLQKVSNDYNIRMTQIMGQDQDGHPTLDANKLLESIRHNKTTEGITSAHNGAMESIARQNAGTSAFNAETSRMRLANDANNQRDQMKLKAAQLGNTQYNSQAKVIMDQYNIKKTEFDSAVREKAAFAKSLQNTLGGPPRTPTDAEKAYADQLDAKINKSASEMDTSYTALDFLQKGINPSTAGNGSDSGDIPVDSTYGLGSEE